MIEAQLLCIPWGPILPIFYRNYIWGYVIPMPIVRYASQGWCRQGWCILCTAFPDNKAPGLGSKQGLKSRLASTD